MERIRIAAAGDIHASPATAEALKKAFAEIAEQADLVLLAGDLTLRGELEEARVVAEACQGLELPVFAVLGNHDYHEGRQAEIADILSEAGLRVLERDWAICEVGGVEVGVVGTKGFVGGFPGSALPDFGEAELRAVYRATTREVSALEEGLQCVGHCGLRVALLHYSPVEDTLAGEPEGIRTFLGAARLGLPLAEYQPDLVVHGHAHSGSFEGKIGSTPVYNVAVHVTGRDFYVFELEVEARGRSAVEHVETHAEHAPLPLP